MTNPNYYHHQNQEDATRATSSFIEKNPDSKLVSSPLRSTAPNSASSSPISFANSNAAHNNSSSMMQTTDSEPNMLEEQIDPLVEHRHYISSPQDKNHGYAMSRGPLSPASAPPTTSLSGGGTAPIPSVIHTESGMGEGSTMARTHSSTPHFPSINAGNTSGGPTLVAKKSNNKVTGKKKSQISKSKSGASLTQSTSNSSLNQGTKSTGQKKQRRLERNRLSAQLSRRRRKQYLEELEERVVRLSLDMDSGRRKHAFQAIDRIKEMRQQVLSSAEAVVREMEGLTHDPENRTMMLNFQLENYMRLLENAGPLARTHSEELLILNSFLGQQLKSFSLPSHAKFILWLSLQGDTYYRGGRAASERLSAARIGERMLVSGNDKVTPTNAMWPLVCNEVGLSYELEERLRVYQRTTILQEKSTWLVRHAARSSALVMQSFHDSVGSMAQVVGNREAATTKEVLTPLQRVKYLAWMKKNSSRVKARLQARRERALQQREMEIDANTIDIGSYVDSNYQLKKSHHLAANLYILNHQLSRILQDYPYHAPHIMTPPILKKLMRRASFESLGQQKEPDGKSMSREDSSTHSMKSHPSNGSLLKSTSNDSLNESERPAQITPQVGEQAAAELVEEALGFVKAIIPPIPKPVNPVMSTVYAPAPVTHNALGTVQQDMAIEYHTHQLVPTPVTSYGAPAQLAPAPPSNHQVAQPPQYETSYHPPNHPAQLHTYSYAASQGQQPPPVYYQAPTEHYYPPQQHVTYTPAHGHEEIAPVYETSSSVIQHPTQAAKSHQRKSSFLPNNLNVVPEDMFPGVEGTAADFIELQDCLMDGEDWGIGIGLDMDTTA